MLNIRFYYYYYCVCVHVHTQSCLTLVTPWTLALQAPLSMEFLRQEYAMGCHFLL